jgi:large subunit ribosomal protein L24
MHDRKLKIRKGDEVIPISGKERFGKKKGRVLKIFAEKNQVIVEGLNFIKKHRRQTRQDRQGGIISIEAPINISNIMLVCPKCGKPTRVGHTKLESGGSARICRRCNEILDK